MKRLTGIIRLPAVAIMLMGAAFCSHWGGKQPATARVYRPEKEEVRYTVEARSVPTEVDISFLRRGEVWDSCIPDSPLGAPSLLPRPC